MSEVASTGYVPRFQAAFMAQAGSGKAALPRPTPPDRACRDHQRVTLTVSLKNITIQQFI
jgi:hypothetical protein